MAQKISDEQMRSYIDNNIAAYLNTFPEEIREEKGTEIEGMDTKKLYQKIHLRLANEAKKQTEIYQHLQYIQKCSEDDLLMLKNAIESRRKTIKNSRKKKAQTEIKKILDKYNKMSGDTLTITFGE